jgi:acyl-CoA thioesterase
VSQFDDDTAVAAAGPKRWHAHFTNRWNIGDKPNGGYILATAVRAMQSELRAQGDDQHPDPLSVTAHYLRPGTPDADVVIDTEMIRVGRQFATIRATLSQAGKERIAALATFGNLDALQTNAAGPSATTLCPPELPDPSTCLAREPLTPGLPSMHEQMVTLLHPNSGWMTGQRSGRAEISGWLGFADGREPDVLSLPLFADAMPPAVFELMDRPSWVPTIELTVHVRARPAPGLLRTVFRTNNLRDGLLDEEGEVWDSEGRLVAQSRQLAMLLT